MHSLFFFHKYLPQQPVYTLSTSIMRAFLIPWLIKEHIILNTLNTLKFDSLVWLPKELSEDNDARRAANITK